MKKKAFISGGASRIGAILSKKLLECGYDLFIHYKSANQHELDTLSSYALKYNNNIKFYQADFNIPESVISLTENICSDINQLDLLIANACYFPQASKLRTDYTFTDEPLEELHKAMRINCESYFVIFQKLLPLLLSTNNPQLITLLDSSIDRIMPSRPSYTLSRRSFYTLSNMMSELNSKLTVSHLILDKVLPPNDSELSEISSFQNISWSGIDQLLQTFEQLIQV